ncbi:hypothetical protein [Qipengyuania sp. NPDC077563]|uniref:hypothetical protein n=1 Tax=Qipengyuania sp. NPDC077563 TaxID=3364497 RepID=UPI00385031F5
MSTKIQMRAGEVEFTFESDNSISVTEAQQFLEKIHDIAKSVGQPKSATSAVTDSVEENSSTQEAHKQSGAPLDLHVNSVAEQLGAKSGPEVAMAAAAFLQLVEGKESFSRKELLETMKEATNYYSQTMSKNLSATLKNLIGSKLTQLKSDRYAIKAVELSNLRSRLAE